MCARKSARVSPVSGKRRLRPWSVVDGVLTVNGRSSSLTLAVEFHGTETYPMDGATHADFSATGSLSRKDYGLEFSVPMAAGGLRDR
jgi:polyisoprenoid-binding protein YceI